jgi:hypothetical protein
MSMKTRKYRGTYAFSAVGAYGRDLVGAAGEGRRADRAWSTRAK